MKNFIILAYLSIKALVTEKFHNPSLVQTWQQRQEDENYLREQITKLQYDISDLEDFLEENPFNLPALDMFSVSEVNYREASARDKLLQRHDLVSRYIFQNRERYQHSAPELLKDYFTARKEFEEQLTRLELD